MTKVFKFAKVQTKTMKYRAKIEVSLKPGHSDPEGETTARLLKELGYRIQAANVSKVYTLILEAESRKEAERKIDEMCKRLLANPTKDNYAVVIEEEK
jgi:phosphoribosylformylglycinamidine synthase